MRKPIWEIRIPTIFALLLIAVSILLTRYFVVQRTSTVGQASSDTQPENIYITDIKDDRFTIAFTTTSPAVAGVQVSGPTLPTSVFFQNSSQEARYTHRITVQNLQPSTEYEYVLLLEGKTYLDKDKPYTVITAPILDDENISPLPVTGKVINADGSPSADTLVVLQSTDAQRISTLTNTNGEYTFDISAIRSGELTNYAEFTAHTQFTIEAYTANQASRVQTAYGNGLIIPPITLSQNYDFSKVSLDSQIASSDAQLSIPTPSRTRTQTALQITSPDSDQPIIDDQPLIQGTATPLTNVTLTFQPSNLTLEVTANASGRWQYRPENPLPQGENTVISQAKDSFGITQSITHEFSIFPAGSQVAQSATPSGTLTPTQAPTNTPLSPTATPTTEITPTTPPPVTTTVAPTVTPTTPVITTAPTLTDTPTPTIQPIITITPTPPGSISTLLITFTSVILIVAGATLLFILG